MNLTEHRRAHVGSLRKTTLGIIRKGDLVNLAMKKRGFGEGKWNFSGGKTEEELNESPEDCVVRETRDELGTDLIKVRLVAILYFYFSDVAPEKRWNQKCYVYEAEKWEGDPAESEEMAPKRWKRHNIPYHEMWQEDESWIEPVLDGKILTGYFLFTSKDECLEKKIVIGQIIDE